MLVASGISGLLLLDSWSTGRLVGWFDGFSWLGLLVARSVGWLCQSVGRSVDWLFDCSVGRLIGCLVVRAVG